MRHSPRTPGIFCPSTSWYLATMAPSMTHLSRDWSTDRANASCSALRCTSNVRLVSMARMSADALANAQLLNPPQQCSVKTPCCGIPDVAMRLCTAAYAAKASSNVCRSCGCVLAIGSTGGGVDGTTTTCARISTCGVGDAVDFRSNASSPSSNNAPPPATVLM